MKSKESIILLAAILLIFSNLSAQQKADSIGTTFQTNNRKVVVSEDGNEVKVKVFNKNDSTEMRAIYEGTFIDGKEYEKYTVHHAIDWGLDLFASKKKKKRKYRANPHWNGIGWGFATITDGTHFDNINGVSIKEECSNEFFINIKEIPFSLYKKNIMVYTGLGVSWKNLSLDGNTRFVEKDGITLVEPAPAEISYKKSRLRVFNVNMPLVFEFQTNKRCHNLFFSAGVVAGVNLFRSQKLKYYDAKGEKVKEYDRGLNVSRLSFEWIAQAGVGTFGIFVKYSPLSLFENDKGPYVQTASLGLRLGF